MFPENVGRHSDINKVLFFKKFLHVHSTLSNNDGGVSVQRVWRSIHLFIIIPLNLEPGDLGPLSLVLGFTMWK